MTNRPTPHAPWKRHLSITATLLAVTAMIWFFHWTVKTSGGFLPPGEEDYYNFLVRGWRSGHLYISKSPLPELIALADPYDPAQNAPFRMGDASYYKGHYYLYFSGAPALVLHLPYGLITGKELGTTTAIFVFCVTGYLALCGTWFAMRRRYFPGSAWWSAPLVVLIFGVSTHLLILQRRPLVWELPLSSGFAFSMLALGSAYLAMHTKRPLLFVASAALFFGLAVASRPTCLFGSILFLPILWYFWKHRPDTLWIRSLVTVSSGVGIFVVALLFHNYQRFDNPLEFGINYQLSSNYESKETHFSLGYAAHNAYIYFVNPIQVERGFPFAKAVAVQGGPQGYLAKWVEPIAGMLVTFPFVWGILCLPFAWKKHATSDTSAFKIMILAVSCFVVTVIGFYLTFFCATPRYMTDFMPSIMLLSAIGFLGLESWADGRTRISLARSLIATVGIITILAGLAVNFDYHQRSLKQLQPKIWEQLENFFK